MTITITIQEETWKMLNMRKEAGDTFDSVIRRALNKESKSARPRKRR